VTSGNGSVGETVGSIGVYQPAGWLAAAAGALKMQEWKNQE